MHHADALAAAAPDAGPLDRAVAREAAQWLVRLQSARAGEADVAACQRWRAANPEHERAWQRAQRLCEKLDLVPPAIGVPALGRTMRSVRRRAMLKTLLALVAVPPAGYLAYRTAPWREWTAQHRTRTGERRAIELADGTRVHLNTATAIDVAFDSERRLVCLLAGEILVETGPDSGNAPGIHRPFIVNTEQGSIRALGTRFVVRQESGREPRTRVVVLEGSVEIRPRLASGPPVVLDAGSQASFTSAAVHSTSAADPNVAVWTQGLLLANGMRLGDFVTELGRHRPGVLRCHPDVADLRITGAFQLGSIDHVLAALPDTLPVSVVYRTRYWVSIVPPQGKSRI